MTTRPDPLAPPEGYGQPRAQGYQHVHERRCVMTLPWEGRCQAPAAWCTLWADMQEHMYPADYCQRCFDVARYQLGQARCEACRTSGLEVDYTMRLAAQTRLADSGPDPASDALRSLFRRPTDGR